MRTVLFLSMLLACNAYGVDVKKLNDHNANVLENYYKQGYGADHANKEQQSETSMTEEADKGLTNKHPPIPSAAQFSKVKAGALFVINTDPKYANGIQDGDEWYRFVWHSIIEGYGPYVVEVEMKNCKQSFSYDKAENFQLKEFWSVVKFTGKYEEATDKAGKKVKLPVLVVTECH